MASTGNVGESRPPGVDVMFVPGKQAEAEKLARLLSTRQARVEPIDPVAAAAAGPNAQVVVVIS